MFFALILFIIIVSIFYLKRKYFTLYGPIPGLLPQFSFGNLIQMGILFRGVSFAHASTNLRK